MQSALSNISAEDFKQQFCNWLDEMHLQFENFETDDDLTIALQLNKEGKTSICIFLIPIECWQQQGNANWEKLIDKVFLLRESGLRSIIIWQDYWERQPEIVKSRLNAMLGVSQKIPARLTLVRRIPQNMSAEFLDKNHLNGSVSAKSRYGLFLPKRYFRVLNHAFEYDNEGDELLVAVATFSAPRVFQRDEGPFRSFEMVRFASLLHTNVSGGLDKLLTAFIREKNPDDVMTYADLEWSEGAGYAKLGFERISQTAPMTFALELNSMIRYPKTAFDKNVLENVMLIRNAGSIKFVKTLNKPHYHG